MKQVNAKQLHEMMLKHPDLPVVDVLPHEVHRAGHIPGTPNVPLADGDFLQQIKRVAARPSQPIVVYCKSKECDASPKAAKQLEEAGYTEVYDFEGGLDEWEQTGYPLVAS